MTFFIMFHREVTIAKLNYIVIIILKQLPVYYYALCTYIFLNTF